MNALAIPLWLDAVAVGFGGLLVAPLLAVVGPLRFRRDVAFTLLDAMSLAMYSVLGTDRAMTVGLPPISCVFVGTVAGVGGALVRDVLINEQPEHFKPGSFYVLAAVPGCIAYFAMRTLELPVPVSAMVAVGVVITVRMTSWSLDWQTGRRRA